MPGIVLEAVLVRETFRFSIITIILKMITLIFLSLASVHILWVGS